MSDDMDPCENLSMWNHELAMRRLITLLRQGQSYCTENECLDNQVLAGRNSWQQIPSSSDNFLIMFLMVALAVGMYALTPRRRTIPEPAKPDRNSTHDNDGAPPTPPTI